MKRPVFSHVLLPVATAAVCLALAVLSASSVSGDEATPGPDFSKDIAPIFQKRCVGCHNADAPEGDLSLESFADLQKGGEHGPAVQPGNVSSSRLLQMVTGEAKPVMPPEDEPRLKPEEIARLIAWIEAGAKGPQGEAPSRRQLLVPEIPAPEGVVPPIASVALSPDGNRLAVARFSTVEIRDATTASLKLLQTLKDFPGKVNSVQFSRDGRRIIAASGITGLFGQASVWKVDDGKRTAVFEGHRDAMFSVRFNPQGEVLATASYDEKIILWDTKTGKQLRTLEGHNGAVFNLDFSPDGEILASASADETVKLWRVSTGVRLDTLSQPLAEQYVVRFSPDGRYVIAGGLDNRIRVWRVLSRKKPKINPLVYSRIAHEGAVIQLGFTPDGSKLVSIADDQTMKLWETAEYTQTSAYESQPDVTPALAMAPDGGSFIVGRSNGTLQRYEIRKESPESEDASASQVAVVYPSADQKRQEFSESEPNDMAEQAESISIPAKITGVINPVGSSDREVAGAGSQDAQDTRDAQNTQDGQDVDTFRFSASAGERWIFEVNAARRKSPLDSRVEVLDTDGKPIERVRLQAVRDSYITFRGINSSTRDCRVHNWEEMDLDQYLYLNGEVVRLWLWPRGPDSGFKFYPQTGNRITYFDTTATSHALQEPCYIVEPHPPGTDLIPNGLPVFPVYFENDDDPLRRFGKDSRLTFTAPADGEYLVRISDARRFGGPDFKYELIARPARPDFNLRLEGDKSEINAGSGKEFKVIATRLDGFDGRIDLAVEGLPDGFEVSEPLFIEAGQNIAYGTINASPEAKQPDAEAVKATKIIATATVNGAEVTREIGGFKEIKLADAPKLLVAIGPDPADGSQAEVPEFGAPNPLELTIAPGETMTARVHIKRNGFSGRIEFEAIAQNLPHGVIVDNIGLNGLLIVEGQSQRQFFLTAAEWVPEQSRAFHLRTKGQGNQTSWRVILHVRKPTEEATESATARK